VTTWRLLADGTLDVTKGGTVLRTSVTAQTLATIANIVGGPDLRLELRDGIQCLLSTTSEVSHLTLEIPSGALEADVSGCLSSGPNGNAPRQIYDELKGY
jgi:hypothetical protein